MRLLDSLTLAFIHTFGITQPTEQIRRRASWFILGLLALTVATLAGVGVVLYRSIRA